MIEITIDQYQMRQAEALYDMRGEFFFDDFSACYCIDAPGLLQGRMIAGWRANLACMPIQGR